MPLNEAIFKSFRQEMTRSLKQIDDRFEKLEKKLLGLKKLIDSINETIKHMRKETIETPSGDWRRF